MASIARWIAFGIVAIAFGPLWYELVAQLYSGVFQGMPPAALFSLERRDPEVLAACALASLTLAIGLRRRIATARGIDTAFLSGAFLLAGALVVPPLWWLIVVTQGVIAAPPSPFGDDTLVIVLYTPLVLSVSGLAWTALIVWAAWPLAALEVWVLGRLVRSPRAARLEGDLECD